jgi:4-amino-4-deoxy-L-arabinose transferase-like glycosyltransferase
VVLVLTGLYLHLHQLADWLVYLIAGIGSGIGLAVTGSLIHDAFVGARRRL